MMDIKEKAYTESAKADRKNAYCTGTDVPTHECIHKHAHTHTHRVRACSDVKMGEERL